MADENTKADVKDDEDDTEGHRKASATPDEDREARSRVSREPSAIDQDDDAEGHRF
jgi:BRCT domain type II-containing protein